MRDTLTADDLRFTPPDLPQEVLAPFLLDHWGIRGEFKALAGERDQNFRVLTDEGIRYVYKIGSPIEDPVLVDFQIKALLRLEQADPDLPVPRMVRTLRGRVAESLIDANGNGHVVRVLSWIPGAPIGGFAPPSVDTIAQIGALQGRMCRALEGFEHAAAGHFMPWDIMNDLVVSENLCAHYLRDGLAERCTPMLDRLKNDSLPRMHRLPHQVIHNDAHSGNVMVDPEDPARVTGVIDFGDLICRPIVVDLATSLASLLERSPAPVRAAAALVRGFQRYTPIPAEQLELLYDATVARAIMTVQLLQFRVEHTQVDTEMRDIDLPQCKAGLERILALDENEFVAAVRQPDRLLGQTG